MVLERTSVHKSIDFWIAAGVEEEGETYILAGDFEVVTHHSPPPFG